MPTLIPTISTESAAYSKLSVSERSRYSKLGTISCISLITNKMIGTGLFSTPSIIFKYCAGNVTLFLTLWLVGAVIILLGLLVYLEYALNLPFKNGGEKNYLLRVFRMPKGLWGCIYAFQMVFLGFSSGNSFAFGKYIWYAISGEPVSDNWQSKAIGVGCITFCIWLHIKFPSQGMSLFNFLGMFKIFILFLIIGIGFLVLLGAVVIPQHIPSSVAHPASSDTYSVAVALLQVVYSFKGWENVNYVLLEVENPYQALTFTAPLSVLLVTALYFMVVISYLIVIPKDELLSSGVLVAGIFFNKIFGESWTSRVLPILISLLTLGNVMVVSFAHSRVNQELALENYLPFSGWFLDLNHSLLLHWAITVVILVAPPSTEIYEFVVNLYIYPGTWINLLLTLGLIYLKLNAQKEQWGKYNLSDDTIDAPLPDGASLGQSSQNSEDGRSMSEVSEEESIQSYNESIPLLSSTPSLEAVRVQIFSTPWGCVLIFLLANFFLALLPFVPPPKASGSIPYWCFPVVGTGCLLMGALFYYARNTFYKMRDWPAPEYSTSEEI